jgi:hypothetical protein
MSRNSTKSAKKKAYKREKWLKVTKQLKEIVKSKRKSVCGIRFSCDCHCSPSLSLSLLSLYLLLSIFFEATKVVKMDRFTLLSSENSFFRLTKRVPHPLFQQEIWAPPPPYETRSPSLPPPLFRPMLGDGVGNSESVSRGQRAGIPSQSLSTIQYKKNRRQIKNGAVMRI